jgi:DNA-binding SARP family transcriptional activator
MISLKSFGTLDLQRDENRSLQAILTQPKRLALVVYLAVATPRGFHRRDTLLGLLWPELDETRARAALNRGVHFVRTSLGEEVLLSRGQDTLGLDWSHFWCDAAGFEEALDRGELAEALALYRGPLLAGFFVDETPAFDGWLESERARLQQRAIQAARQLSEQEESAGRTIPAIEWARRATTLAPQDEAALRRLMQLLERANDRAGAVRAYSEFEKALATDLGVEPTAETRGLSDAIRSREASTNAVVMAPPEQSYALLIPTAPAALSPASAAAPLPARVARVRPRAATIAAALVATAGLIWGASRLSAARSAARDEVTVAVTTFSTASGVSAALADSLAEQLRIQLDSIPSLRAMRAAARGSAQFAVTGMIAARGDRLSVVASLDDSTRRDDLVSRASAVAAPGQIGRLARDLAWQLGELKTTRGEYFPTRSAAQSRSVTALEAEERGKVAYGTGQFTTAVREFRKAVEIDSTFGGAYLKLSMAAQWDDQWSVVEWASGMAIKHLNTFSPVDQFRARAWDAYVGGRPQEAERLFRITLANNPGDADAMYFLGEVLFHWGPVFGWSLGDARQAFEQVDSLGAWRREASRLGMLLHLARIAGMEGRPRLVDSLASLGLLLDAGRTQRLELRALRAFAGSQRQDQDEVLAEIGRLDDATAINVATIVAVSAADNEDAVKAVDAAAHRGRSTPARGRAEVLRRALLLAHGRSSELGRLEHLAPVFHASRVLEYRAVVATLPRPFITMPRDTLLAIRAALSSFPGEARTHIALYDTDREILSFRRLYLLGLLSARIGDLARAAQSADTLEQPPFLSLNDKEWRLGPARVLRATVLRANGKSRAALDALGEPQISTPDRVVPHPLSYTYAEDRFLRAELLRELHRDDEALRWYETFPDAGGYDLPYLAPALLRRAEIVARRGDAAGAAALRTRAGRLWSHATAEFTAPR